MAKKQKLRDVKLKNITVTGDGKLSYNALVGQLNAIKEKAKKSDAVDARYAVAAKAIRRFLKQIALEEEVAASEKKKASDKKSDKKSEKKKTSSKKTKDKAKKSKAKKKKSSQDSNVEHIQPLLETHITKTEDDNVVHFRSTDKLIGSVDDDQSKAPVELVSNTDPLVTKLDKPKGEKDDLKLIAGVGPKLEELLNGLGVYHFWQVAEWKREEIDWVDNYLQFTGRIERDNWVEQAKALAKGGRDEYVKVFGKEPR